MKLRFLVLVLIGLMATSTFAATTGTWIQSPVVQCGGMGGNWTDTSMWKSSALPVITTNTGDEVKLTTPKGKTIINSAVGNYNCKLTMAGGTNDIDKHRMEILSGSIGVGQFQIGHGGSTDKGKWGSVVQTGGTVSAEKLMLGYYGTRTQLPLLAHGEYTISGGTLQSNSGMSTNTGRLLIGAGITTGSTTANNEGVLTIIGGASTISMKELYVGGYSTFVGTGTINYKIKSDGVSQITVSNGITLPAAGVANLNVVMCESYLGEDIVLIENTGASAVSGAFDLINGIAAIEGAEIILGSCADYTLTYEYDASTGAHTGGNDIALIPEPATIALLGLGLIAIRRKK